LLRDESRLGSAEEASLESPRISFDSNRQRRALLARLTLWGTFLGLGVGLYEAALLYYTPWLPTLPSSDVSGLIWFITPLLDMAFYAILGLAAGWVASLSRARGPQYAVCFAAALVGVMGAHVAWSLKLAHIWMADLDALKDVKVPLEAFFAVFLGMILLVITRWRAASRLFEADAAWPSKRLAGLVGTVCAGLILGLGVCYHAISTPPTRVRAQAGGPAPRPNIVVIILDTVRADHLSAYGYQRPTTPNIDRFANGGVLFENAVAPCSWTLPTFASILTGLLPHQHGADPVTPLNAAPRTLAEILRDSGYETVGFVANGYGLAGWGLQQGFDFYDDNSSTLTHNLAPTLVGRALVQPLYHDLIHPDFIFRRNAEELNHRIFSWFERRSGRPYFLFINYFDAHDPYFAPAPFNQRFGKLTNQAAGRLDRGATFPLDPPLTPAELDSLIGGYDNSLAYLDHEAGRLLDLLSRSPDWKNTVVIIASDHGESFGEHGMYLHGRDLYYREVLHVPLILVGPTIPSALRLKPLVRLEDLFSTILDLALRGQLPLRRTSLRRFWTPGYQPVSSDDIVVSELIPFLPDFRPVMISLTTHEWHYLHDSSGRAELYHYSQDPFESENLADRPEHQVTLEKLDRRLRQLEAHSLRPWRGADYLFALNGPRSSFLHEVAFEPQKWSEIPEMRIGVPQAFFAADAESVGRGEVPAEEELLRSLPYR
jgi:arylsulfatase A-like enzyme/uncharacterized membrane protein YeaQ/YmgE (transglycosylase-associated protein family)